MAQQKATIVIKNPSRSDGVPLEVPLDATLAQLQALITQQYPGNPQPADQTLIHAGKVLKDVTVTIRALVEKHEPITGPHNFHLVIKQGTAANAAPTSSKPPASSSSAAPTAAPAAASGASTSSSAGQASSSGAAQAAQASTSTAGASAGTGNGTTPAAPPATTPATSVSAPPPGPEPASAAHPQDPWMGMGAEMPGMQGMHLPTDYYASMGHFAVPPYMYYNPVVASAYQAAYIAALAVGASQQQVAQAATPSAGASAPEAGATAAPQYIPPAWPMMAMQQQAYMASLQQAAMEGAAMQQQQQRLLQLLGVPAGYQGQVLVVGQPGDRAAGAAPAAAGQGLRQRRPGAAPAAAAANAARPRRQRVFTLRISMRGLLQVLVFSMVLYQHFTWNRFMALLALGFLLWVTSLAPLRRFIANMHAPPPPHRPNPAPAAAAAQPGGAGAGAGGPAAAAGAAGGQQGAAAGAQGPAAAAPHAPAQHQGPPRRGIMAEIAMVLVSFVTSLLPGWNANPEDAAAFAMAQEMFQREQQQQQRQEPVPAPAPDAGAQAAAAAGAGAGAAAAGDGQARPRQQDEEGRDAHAHQA